MNGSGISSWSAWLMSSSPAAWLQGLGTLMIGSLAAYIAYLGATTARKKLKFDMFEKRLEAYRGIASIFRDVMVAGRMASIKFGEFERFQAEARFLYADEHIDDYLQTAHRRLISLTVWRDGSQGDDKELVELHQRWNYLVKYEDAKKAGNLKEAAELLEGSSWLQAMVWLNDHHLKWADLTVEYLRVHH